MLLWPIRARVLFELFNKSICNITKHLLVSELVSFTVRGTSSLRRTFKLQEYIPPSFMLISLRTNEVDSEIPSSFKVSVRFSPSLDNHKLFSVVVWLPLNVMLQKIVAGTEWSTVRLETVTLGMSLSERKRTMELLLPECCNGALTAWVLFITNLNGQSAAEGQYHNEPMSAKCLNKRPPAGTRRWLSREGF